ncbi:MAG: FAD-dependent oxidoreductase [Verrucomicrobiota bacterium]
MSDSKPHVVILGGGVCGLYAARKLTQADFKVTIVEKGEGFGGLAACIERHGNFYDLGVHMLHEYDREIFEDCKEMMGDERVPVQLDARIRWAGSYYRYPLQFADMIRGMPPQKLAHCVMGLFWAQLRNKVAPWEPRDCEEALQQLYGTPLYDFFFKEFTTRYWGMPPTEMSANFVRRKMPRLTAVDAIRKFLAYLGIKEKPGRSTQSALLEETLHYSAQGAQALPRSIARAVEKAGANLVSRHVLKKVHMTDGRVRAVTVEDTHTEESREIECDEVISTIPVGALIEAIQPAPLEGVCESVKQLKYLPLVAYGLLVKKPRVLDALYVYYRERIFHRVGEPKNAGLSVTPEAHTVLIVEMTCQHGSPEWEGDPAVLDTIYKDLEAEGICTADDVVEVHMHRSETAYPVFALGYEPHFDRVYDYLNGLPNLQSVGRQGGFCFPGMHSAMRIGADAAEKVIAEHESRQ